MVFQLKPVGNCTTVKEQHYFQTNCSGCITKPNPLKLRRTGDSYHTKIAGLEIRNEYLKKQNIDLRSNNYLLVLLSHSNTLCDSIYCCRRSNILSRRAQQFFVAPIGIGVLRRYTLIEISSTLLWLPLIVLSTKKTENSRILFLSIDLLPSLTFQYIDPVGH
ncbi:hypothetical protein AKO1_006951 [Acrasis kona]|uniref:Uncharacterized protein n=1 Tax=Acrasis kona TaxID=1008807 RepID=A0AAW2YUU4_9EUKA